LKKQKKSFYSADFSLGNIIFMQTDHNPKMQSHVQTSVATLFLWKSTRFHDKKH